MLYSPQALFKGVCPGLVSGQRYQVYMSKANSGRIYVWVIRNYTDIFSIIYNDADELVKNWAIPTSSLQRTVLSQQNEWDVQ